MRYKRKGKVGGNEQLRCRARDKRGRLFFTFVRSLGTGNHVCSMGEGDKGLKDELQKERYTCTQ